MTMTSPPINNNTPEVAHTDRRGLRPRKKGLDMEIQGNTTSGPTVLDGGRGLEQHRRVSSVWKSYLYQLQQEAPKPAAVLCTDRPPDSPPYYGLEYHGTIGRHHCETLLTENGTYIVRHSERAEGFYTLSMRFNDVIKHFRLFYDGKHYVGEKRFDTVHDLVADGLVTLYMESQAGEYLKKMSATSYLNSPHYTLTKSLRRHIRTNRYTGVDTENRQPICPKDTTTLSKPEDQDKDSNNTQDITTQRPHRFNVHTFTGLHWCGLCGHFLWGFVSQGVKCQDCNFKAHKQCSCKVPNDCCPDLKDLQSIFGADLTTSLRGSTDRVPSVVTECVSEVEARGLTMEGIYRVPGSQDQIEALRLAFERDGNRVNLNEKAVSDINVVAGVLKLYLRLLPIPLITSQCFLRLQAVCKLSTREAKVSGIREALLTLPVAHLSTLKVIIMHLARVCDHSAVNKMTATSLSTVFAPTLVQSAAPGENIQPADLLAMANSAQEPRVVEVLLVYHRDIFL
ncbi:N-chimaerin-like isoform X2 [Penaeus japonicus]|uniref:N-chimaerin-like isoform X2 n=1 Tax=Penaeus japonicus TaxID=27405 RepID=UPI001C715B53|nr:N-chimaerin-like isoform X2 [Penaeus japonicus]